MHNIHTANSTWKRFLELYDYPDNEKIAAVQAKETAISHYCRSCDCEKLFFWDRVGGMLTHASVLPFQQL